MIPNIEIKQKLVEYNIPKYQLAEEMQIADTSLSRKLRNELDSQEKEIILQLIENIKENKSTKEVLEKYKTYHKSKRTEKAKNIRVIYTHTNIYRKLEEIEQRLINLEKK